MRISVQAESKSLPLKVKLPSMGTEMDATRVLINDDRAIIDLSDGRQVVILGDEVAVNA